MVIAILILIAVIAIFSTQILAFASKLRQTPEEAAAEEQTAQENADKGVVGQAVDLFLGGDEVKASTEVKSLGDQATNNLLSNLTATPLPDDPIFGEKGIFAFLFQAQQNVDPITIDELDKLASDELKTDTTFETQTRFSGTGSLR